MTSPTMELPPERRRQLFERAVTLIMQERGMSYADVVRWLQNDDDDWTRTDRSGHQFKPGDLIQVTRRSAISYDSAYMAALADILAGRSQLKTMIRRLHLLAHAHPALSATIAVFTLLLIGAALGIFLGWLMIVSTWRRP